MTPESANLNLTKASTTLSFAAGPTKTAHRLTDAETAEVLSFLGERALHTFVMSGFIRDNGLESERNRGRFYGYRDQDGTLAGVALIGHATFVEAQHDKAFRELAIVAQESPRIHMILGEEETVERFRRHYTPAGQRLRHVCREVLFGLNNVDPDFKSMPELRLATLNDLCLVAPVQAALACEESGVNPLESDRRGFLQRCQRRIELNRCWVWRETDELIFKADIISETPQVIYLEGIYVADDRRGEGIGSRCLSQMARTLLKRANAIVVLVNEHKRETQNFFQRVGFTRRAFYQTQFLEVAQGEAENLALSQSA